MLTWNRRLFYLFVFPLALATGGKASGGGRPLVESTRYTFHPTEHCRQMVMAVSPDQTLLTFLGNIKGPSYIRRLTSWSGPAPHSDMLTLTGFPQSRIPANSASFYVNLNITLDGRYAVTRVETPARKKPSSAGPQWFAIIHVVDLKSFTTVLTLETSDPLLAGSQWVFRRDGLILASFSLGDTKGPPLTMHSSIASLSMPDLHMTSSCRYQEILPAPQEHAISVFKSLSDGCQALLESARAPNIENLIDSNRRLDRIAKQLDFHPKRAALLGTGCRILDTDMEERLALYECGTGHPTWYDTYKETVRSFIVVGIPTAAEIAYIAAKPEQMVSATLSSLNGKHAVLLLRNTIDLSVYSID